MLIPGESNLPVRFSVFSFFLESLTLGGLVAWWVVGALQVDQALSPSEADRLRPPPGKLRIVPEAVKVKAVVSGFIGDDDDGEKEEEEEEEEEQEEEEEEEEGTRRREKRPGKRRRESWQDYFDRWMGM